MAAILNKKNFLRWDFWELFTRVLSGHPSNFPESFSFLHFFPGWHDFWANAPGLHVDFQWIDLTWLTLDSCFKTKPCTIYHLKAAFFPFINCLNARINFPGSFCLHNLVISWYDEWLRPFLYILNKIHGQSQCKLSSITNAFRVWQVQPYYYVYAISELSHQFIDWFGQEIKRIAGAYITGFPTKLVANQSLILYEN